MNSSPLVSVIVPTYNRPDFLIKTLQSILSQTCQDIELIVISNGVNENNEQAVKSLQDPRVRYADQINSGGPASPRNHGIRLARGKYLAFCDDDDLWLPTKLEKQLAVLENNLACGFSYTRMVSFDETGHEWFVQQKENPATFNSLLYVSEVPVSSVVVRADLVHKHGGFYEGAAVGAAEDYEFALRYASRTQFSFIDEVLMRYWAGQNRTTAAVSTRRTYDHIRHIKDTLGCYWVFIRGQKASILPFIKPAFFCIKQDVKAIIFDFLKRHGWR